MNILFLSNHLHTGGITSYILSLAKGLQKAGHKVFIASADGNMVEGLKSDGLEHLSLNIRTKSELSPKIYMALPRLRRFIKEKNIDIVHTHTRTTQVMGTFLRRLVHKPHVTTCHGFFKRRLSRWLFPCWGDLVIAISEPVRNHLVEDFRVSPERITLIHNGVDLTQFPLSTEDIKRQNRLKFGLDSGPLLGIIARLAEVKGHRILIAAMKRVIEKFPTAHLMIVGEGRLDEALRVMVKDLDLERHVRFYPIVDRTAEILSILDIFVMPSLQEGLGLSVMEAQAAGVAVVATKVGGLPSLIENGETGLLVEKENEEQLATAILHLLNNPHTAKDMGLKARRFIEENFSLERMVQETLRAYQSLLG